MVIDKEQLIKEWVAEHYGCETYEYNAHSRILKIHRGASTRKLVVKYDKKRKEMVEVKYCVICSKEIVGWGNNAQPIRQGTCCDDCNNTAVIPARIKEIRNATTE